MRGMEAFRPDQEMRQLLEEVRALAGRNIPHEIKEQLMALQADVQKLVDEVKQNNDLVGSVAQALQIQGKQIDDLKAQIAGLQAGQIITPDDLSAIQKAVTDLGETNTELQGAVPGNTPGQPTIPAEGPVPVDTANNPAQPDTPATNPNP